MVDFLLKYSQWIIYIGAIISASGGYLASVKADKESAISSELTRKLHEQVENINNEVTGGDSFPFFNIDIYNEGKEIEFKLYNYGTINLKDVSMEISDGAKIGTIDPSLPSNFVSEMNKYVTTKTFAILYPNSSLPINDFKIDDKFKDICLTIQFRFGNKHLVESILFYDYKKSDLRRGVVKIFDGNKVLLHYTIDKDFKRNYIVGFNV